MLSGLVLDGGSFVNALDEDSVGGFPVPRERFGFDCCGGGGLGVDGGFLSGGAALGAGGG